MSNADQPFFCSESVIHIDTMVVVYFLPPSNKDMIDGDLLPPHPPRMDLRARRRRCCLVLRA